MKKPQDRVIELLRTLDEAQNDWGGGGGDGVRCMPAVYQEGSYKELERCLSLMREEAKPLWLHVTGRYLHGEQHTIYTRSRKTQKGREPVLPRCTEPLITVSLSGSDWMQVKVYTWSTAIQPRLCDAGIDWLVATMYGGDYTRIVLPKVFLYRAMGMMEKVAV